MRWIGPVEPSLTRACLPSWLAAAALAACNLGDPAGLPDGGGEEPTVDGAADGSGEEPRSDAEGGGGLDGDAQAGPGPITLVATEITVETARDDDRCDHDGDGVGDNSLADLGEPHATLVTSALSTAITSSIVRGNRWIFHMPHVDDRLGPSGEAVTLLAGGGLDEDSCSEGDELCARREAPPGSHDDDFSGEEGFWLKSEDLDDCGEPLSVATGVALREGSFETPMGRMQLRVTLENATLWGEVLSGGEGAVLTACGAATAHELGADDMGDQGGDGLSLLEALVTGGAAFGVPAFPGVEPDLDLDGDGLERFEVDGEGRLLSCIDGDSTEIVGPECWRDDRIADGFSIVMSAAMVGARFLGRDPFWEHRECGAALDGLDSAGCAASPGCRESYFERLCPSHLSRLAGIVSCVEGSCADACALPLSDACGGCRDERCGPELAACVEAPACCAEPPETSVFDAE